MPSTKPANGTGEWWRRFKQKKSWFVCMYICHMRCAQIYGWVCLWLCLKWMKMAKKSFRCNGRKFSIFIFFSHFYLFFVLQFFLHSYLPTAFLVFYHEHLQTWIIYDTIRLYVRSARYWSCRQHVRIYLCVYVCVLECCLHLDSVSLNKGTYNFYLNTRPSGRFVALYQLLF